MFAYVAEFKMQINWYLWKCCKVSNSVAQMLQSVNPDGKMRYLKRPPGGDIYFIVGERVPTWPKTLNSQGSIVYEWDIPGYSQNRYLVVCDRMY